MPGCYCRYCERRCFVQRRIVVGGLTVWSGHMATCERGKRFDRERLGQDSDTAENPSLRIVKPEGSS